MLLLAAIVLAQCSVTDSIVCPGPIAAPRGQFYIVEPYGSTSGNALKSHRAYDDQSADLSLSPKDYVCRDLETPHIALYDCNSNAVWLVLNSGEVQGGGHQDSASAFTDISSSDGHVTMRTLYGYVNLRSHAVNNGGFHPYLLVADDHRYDGGLALQVQSIGKTSANGAVFPNTTYAVDVFGNQILRDGWVYQQLRTADRGACYTSNVWDGEWHQPGGYGYDVDEDALVFRSSAACAADGGVEHVVTDRSLSAALALINARLTALEAR